MGEAVARQLTSAGAQVLLSDLVTERAVGLAEELGARWWVLLIGATLKADVFAPCAVGGVIDDTIARRLEVRVVCGAANNVLADDRAGDTLMERGVMLVPDVLSSSGLSLMESVAASWDYRTEVISWMKFAIRRFVILNMAQEENIAPHRVAMDVADARLAQAREAK